jgi:hypothetical protein
VTTGHPAEGGFTAKTALDDIDPARTIVPARVPGVPPPAVPLPEDPEVRWRGLLLAAAVLLLIFDLLLQRR